MQVKKTDNNTSASVIRAAQRSGIQILKLDDLWKYARIKPLATQSVTPVWQNVLLNSSDELDSSIFTHGSDNLTLKAP